MTDAETKTEDPKPKKEKRPIINIKIDINKATWVALLSALGAGGYTGWSNLEADKTHDETKVGVELQVNDAWENTRHAITKLTEVIRRQNQHIEDLQKKIDTMEMVVSKAHPGQWHRVTQDTELDEIDEITTSPTPTSAGASPPVTRDAVPETSGKPKATPMEQLQTLETELPETIQFPKMDRVKAAIEKGNGS